MGHRDGNKFTENTLHYFLSEKDIFQVVNFSSIAWLLFRALRPPIYAKNIFYPVNPVNPVEIFLHSCVST